MNCCFKKIRRALALLSENPAAATSNKTERRENVMHSNTAAEETLMHPPNRQSLRAYQFTLNTDYFMKRKGIIACMT